MLTSPTYKQIEAAVVGSDIPDPLPLASRGDQILLALNLEKVDGRSTGYARLATLDLQNPASQNADAQSCESGDDVVDDVLGEPARWPVVTLLDFARGPSSASTSAPLLPG